MSQNCIPDLVMQREWSALRSRGVMFIRSHSLSSVHRPGKIAFIAWYVGQILIDNLPPFRAEQAGLNLQSKLQ